jgi:hypothetical protein
VVNKSNIQTKTPSIVTHIRDNVKGFVKTPGSRNHPCIRLEGLQETRMDIRIQEKNKKNKVNVFFVRHFDRLAICICCSKEGSRNNTLLKHQSAHSISDPRFSRCETSCRLKCLHGCHVCVINDEVRCLE